jgi:hypothetical protein
MATCGKVERSSLTGEYRVLKTWKRRKRRACGAMINARSDTEDFGPPLSIGLGGHQTELVLSRFDVVSWTYISKSDWREFLRKNLIRSNSSSASSWQPSGTFEIARRRCTTWLTTIVDQRDEV